MSREKHQQAESGAQPPGNWGRWGAEDERGAANLLTPELLRAAAGLVRRGRIYSLSLPVQSKGVPVGSRRSPPLHFMTLDGGDYAAGLKLRGGFQTSDDHVSLGTHVTTHIDALAHVWYDDRLYNGFAGDTVRSSGAKRCGIDKLRHLVGRGVLLDFCKLKASDPLPAGYAITPEDLRQCATLHGVALREGDIVLIRTGWQKTFAEKGNDAFFASEPGIGLAAAEWLAQAGVVAIGCDNYGVEVVPTEQGRPAPVHGLLLRDYGVYLMELLVLDEPARDEVHEFLFVAAPLAITGGAGSPLNPLAIA